MKPFFKVNHKIYEYVGILGFALAANMIVAIIYQTNTAIPLFHTIVAIICMIISSVIFLNFSETIKTKSLDHLKQKTQEPQAIWVFNNIDSKFWLIIAILIFLLPPVGGLFWFSEKVERFSFNKSEPIVYTYSDGWAKWYDYYAQKIGLYELEYELISNIVKKHNFHDSISVLDAASGTGDLVNLLLKDTINNYYIVYGADGSNDMITYARKKHKLKEEIFINSLWQELPDKVFGKVDGNFSLIVILGNSIAQLTDTTEAKLLFNDIYAELNHDGIFIIDTDASIPKSSYYNYNHQDYKLATFNDGNGIQFLTRDLQLKGDKIIEHLELKNPNGRISSTNIEYSKYLLDPEYLKSCLNEVGFSCVEYKDIGYPFTVLLCKTY